MVIFLAILIDFFLGEPRYCHPLVGFGKMARFLEDFVLTRKNIYTHPIILKLVGLLSVGLLVAPVVCFIFTVVGVSNDSLLNWFFADKIYDHVFPVLQQKKWLKFPITYVPLFVNVLILYWSIGMKSLVDHADSVANALKRQDIECAREKVKLIVSRDTESMEETDVARAAVESVLENGNDAVFAAIFWYLILGAPGVVLYRLANTLDAMWGYKTERYLYFGWAAARLDDLLNWIPARLTAATYTLVGNIKLAWECWCEQAKLWYSPNAGPVMAAGAGALSLELGGQATYHGKLKARPILGKGKQPKGYDIERAIKLVYKSLGVWIVVVLIGELLHA